MTGWVERVGCYDEGTSRGVLSGCVLRVCQQGMSKVSLILPATHRVDVDGVGAASEWAVSPTHFNRILMGC